MNTTANFATPVESMIQKTLAQYFEADGNRSYRSLETRTDVSRSYIQRMAQGDIPMDKIDILKLHKVLTAVLGAEEAKELIASDAKLKKRYLDFLEISNDMFKNVSLFNDFEFVMKDTETMVVFHLASNDYGTTVQQVKDVLGEAGLIALDKMLKREIVVRDNERIVLGDDILKNQKEDMVLVTHEQCKHLISKMVKFYHSHRRGRNHISYTSSSVSKEFLLRLQKKMGELVGWIDQEVPKKENKGDNPFFCGLVMDTFMENLKEDGGVR